MDCAPLRVEQGGIPKRFTCSGQSQRHDPRDVLPLLSLKKTLGVESLDLAGDSGIQPLCIEGVDGSDAALTGPGGAPERLAIVSVGRHRAHSRDHDPAGKAFS